ncbi:hypothetical protein [Mycolicibacterium sarraceniae]|uniref:Uncharacterized protein n=1 Tax=Mycolicibacterium sarraceniae TaxID=1534348 RepID=A0A7I7SWF2_9MYCO|nr:hypothetical protein [Mycolicibacterium sarraceniae]BBY61334.1 hypothetical protein MSAR_44700 [Mycolicibacterium sarraceniae]
MCRSITSVSVLVRIPWTPRNCATSPTGAYLVTGFDLPDGDDGVTQDGVRCEQVWSGTGDRLFYHYGVSGHVIPQV